MSDNDVELFAQLAGVFGGLLIGGIVGISIDVYLGAFPHITGLGVAACVQSWILSAAAIRSLIRL